MGEYEPLPYEWIDEDDLREPMPGIKDVYATLCLNTNNQKNEALPNLYNDISHQTHKGI